MVMKFKVTINLLNNRFEEFKFTFIKLNSMNAEEFHRINGPATVRNNGVKYWYKDGKYHRDNGSAIEFPRGVKFWWQNGVCHRLDGPAIEYPNGKKLYYINGKDYLKEKFDELVAKLK